jgi:hypothetical protein
MGGKRRRGSLRRQKWRFGPHPIERLPGHSVEKEVAELPGNLGMAEGMRLPW